MSETSREALARGTHETATVRAYLEHLRSPQGPDKTRRLPAAEVLQRRLDTTNEQLEATDMDVLERLRLTQLRQDLTRDLTARTVQGDDPQLEASFVEVAHAFAERKGVDYESFRAVGVPARVLRAAGIARSGH